MGVQTFLVNFDTIVYSTEHSSSQSRSTTFNLFYGLKDYNYDYQNRNRFFFKTLYLRDLYTDGVTTSSNGGLVHSINIEIEVWRSSTTNGSVTVTIESKNNNGQWVQIKKTTFSPSYNNGKYTYYTIPIKSSEGTFFYTSDLRMSWTFSTNSGMASRNIKITGPMWIPLDLPTAGELITVSNVIKAYAERDDTPPSSGDKIQWVNVYGINHNNISTGVPPANRETILASDFRAALVK